MHEPRHVERPVESRRGIRVWWVSRTYHLEWTNALIWINSGRENVAAFMRRVRTVGLVTGTERRQTKDGSITWAGGKVRRCSDATSNNLGIDVSFYALRDAFTDSRTDEPKIPPRIDHQPLRSYITLTPVTSLGGI